MQSKNNLDLDERVKMLKNQITVTEVTEGDLQAQPKKKFSVPWLQYPSFKDDMGQQAPHEITIASGNYHK